MKLSIFPFFLSSQTHNIYSYNINSHQKHHIFDISFPSISLEGSFRKRFIPSGFPFVFGNMPSLPLLACCSLAGVLEGIYITLLQDIFQVVVTRAFCFCKFYFLYLLIWLALFCSVGFCFLLFLFIVLIWYFMLDWFDHCSLCMGRLVGAAVCFSFLSRAYFPGHY